MGSNTIPNPIVTIQLRMEEALAGLGLHARGVGTTTPLAAWVTGSAQLAKKWRGVSLPEDLVPSSLSDRFPLHSPWTGLWVVRFGGDKVKRIAHHEPDTLRRESRKYGIVFEDAAILLWRQVLWLDSDQERVFLVEQSMHYQVSRRRGSGEASRVPDWVCRYDYSPLAWGTDTRCYVAQPVHHVHMGPMDQARVHFPLHPRDGFTVLWWLLHAFPKSAPLGAPELLEQQRDRVCDLLTRDLRPLCERPPFPEPTAPQ